MSVSCKENSGTEGHVPVSEQAIADNLLAWNFKQHLQKKKKSVTYWKGCLEIQAAKDSWRSHFPS